MWDEHRTYSVSDAEAQDVLRQLSHYYGSDVQKRDLADEEACRLPQGLKRGVLLRGWRLEPVGGVRYVKDRMRQIVAAEPGQAGRFV